MAIGTVVVLASSGSPVIYTIESTALEDQSVTSDGANNTVVVRICMFSVHASRLNS